MTADTTESRKKNVSATAAAGARLMMGKVTGASTRTTMSNVLSKEVAASLVEKSTTATAALLKESAPTMATLETTKSAASPVPTRQKSAKQKRTNGQNRIRNAFWLEEDAFSKETNATISSSQNLDVEGQTTDSAVHQIHHQLPCQHQRTRQ